MHLKASGLACLAAGLLLWAAPAFADPAAAKADLKVGMAKEKAGDYTDAIADFEAALRERPAFPQAYKQLGNCYYGLGDYRRALQDYNTYLASRLDDGGTWAVARPLRKRVEQDDREDRAAAMDPGTPNPGTFYAGAAGSVGFPDGNDLLNFPGESNGTVDADLAGAAEAHFGYLEPAGWGLEAGFEDWLRTANVHTQDYFFSDSNHFVIAEYEAYAEPLFRLPLGKGSALIAGLRLGASEALLSQEDYGYGEAWAGALVLAPELRYQYLFSGRYGLELGGEYRYVDFGSLNTEAGPIPDSNGSGNWTLVDSGLVIRVGFDVYFNRLAL